MKLKLFALVMALMLCLTSLAFAETVQYGTAEDPFAITVVLPEGYKGDYAFADEYLLLMLDAEGATTDFWITIGYSEEWDDRTITELTAEEKEELIAMFNEDFSIPKVTEKITKEGTPLIVMDEDDPESESDFALVFTVYRGYFVLVNVWNKDFSHISEENIDLAVEILGDTHFVE